MDVNNLNVSNSTLDLLNSMQTGSAANNENSASNNSEDAVNTILNAEQNTTPAYVYEKSTEKADEYKPDAAAIQKMMKESNQKTESMRQLVEKLLHKQGVTAEQAFGKIASGEEFMIEVDEETRKKAEEEVSEDGYYGVKQTSERILDFAKAISGGDPSKIEGLREAVERGFESAEKLWGDELPEITQKTHEAVMSGFDEWAKATSSENSANA